MNPLQSPPLLLEWNCGLGGWVVVVKCSKVRAWVGGEKRRSDWASRMCDIG